MSTVPADSAGDLTVTEVDELTTRLLPAVAPKFTAVAPVRPTPVMVTVVPPLTVRCRVMCVTVAP